ncbi:MAG: efflux RND transporter periplasmic adaptor subunit [Dehalococcoidales bacterium]|nr:efflux RND transporter periplasmic adaptor subunit [Dehalococcoidales bacterium]
MKRRKIVAVVLSCLALVGILGCRPIGGGAGATGSSIELVAVVRGDLMISVSGSGSVDVVNEIDLSFDDGGEIEAIYVEEGDEVYRGQRLAQLVPLDEEALELAVTRAEAALMQTQYSLDKAENPFTDDEIEEAEQAVDDAEDYLDLADDMLRYALRHGSEWEVLQWQMEVLNAEIQLEMAEDTLDDMLNERDEDQIAVLKKEVTAAEQALAEARRALETEVLTAPFAGVIARVNVEEGDIIPAPSVSQVAVIQMIDNSLMELVVELDEIDIPGVALGQQAVIEIDALPELVLEGKVSSISPLPRLESGVVFYSVKISFDVPPASGIRAGMSATADVVLSDRSDVLLVPDRAVKYDAQGNPVVQVMVTGAEGASEIEERPVVIGMSDGYQTEIISGLVEGEMVVIEIPAETTQDSTNFMFGG